MRTIKKNKIFMALSITILGIVLALSFNNCGRGTTLSQSSLAIFQMNPNLLNAVDACAEKDIDVFERGYHQFFKAACVNCHVNGPGTGQHAHPDVNVAFRSFQMHGYAHLSDYAVSDSHAFPNTSTNNLPIISALKRQWQTYTIDKFSCNSQEGQSTPPPEETQQDVAFDPLFESTTKDIPQLTATIDTITVNGAQVQVTTYSRHTLTWQLNAQEILPLKGTPVPVLNDPTNPIGSRSGTPSISVDVTGFKTSSGRTAYLFTMPTLRVGNISIHLIGINFRLNGFPVYYATTYKKIDKFAYQGTDQLLAAGSLVSVGPFGANDKLSIQIGNIVPAPNMPAPPPPPQVGFKVTQMTIQANQKGYGPDISNPIPGVEIEVEVENDFVDPIAAPIIFPAPNSPDYQGLNPAIYAFQTVNGRHRFDWDYKFDGSVVSTLNFTNNPSNPNYKKAKFYLRFSDDLRVKQQKTLIIKLSPPLGANLNPAKSTLTITIPDYNSASGSGLTKYSDLMNPVSGIFTLNCLKCHNSVDLQGNYDITDYRMMKKNRVIVEGNPDPSFHKMAFRINPYQGTKPACCPNSCSEDVAFQCVTPTQSMPLDGWLSVEERQLINEWIMSGAPNN